ncbi:conjugative transfer signal peptidase TraF [Rhizobium pusense]|uniref:Conjugative transfer signal peptidase TraF n=4 Tax=Hyphomicrobiales TaxID=356 RepID=A0AB34DJ63_9HYPH|nr:MULTISPECIES: conjugative transfer signal peptidase TraF [Hyphomicrobiales]QCM13828.1 conjugative transfer signal peptidase TraF [Agrobacterium tumefaciens]KAB2701548.1 conjugative transfer signal peptidase TraF [Brucella lupini]MDH0912462.1 conjugative transfer signal peptidase TraF [Agrobacterium pusense]MDH1098568.1 conjugative transfer signal peptidase TraF [Agrobacterium pusense]MDH1115278.1 conjugative transfer signal peptidase TraF [Agrobacterium pusense]
MIETTTYQRQQRGALLLLAAFAGFILIVSVGGLAGRLRVNTTPSEPLGIWRIVLLDRAAQVGDTVFVCLPTTATVMDGKTRGYLRPGLCPGGFGPLIKTIIAVGGQQVDVASGVSVDGRVIPSSRPLARDGRGRPLRPYEGGVVPARSIFLHSAFSGSWDSRYFGPIPEEGILGLASEVLTFAP